MNLYEGLVYIITKQNGSEFGTVVIRSYILIRIRVWSITDTCGTPVFTSFMLIEHLDGKQTFFYQKDARVIDLGPFSLMALGILQFAKRMKWFLTNLFFVFVDKLHEALFAELLENFTVKLEEDKLVYNCSTPIDCFLYVRGQL